MESKEITELLVRLKNEDETKWLENLKSVLDYYRESNKEKYKELIYSEYNRLSDTINDCIRKEIDFISTLAFTGKQCFCSFFKRTKDCGRGRHFLRNI